MSITTEQKNNFLFVRFTSDLIAYEIHIKRGNTPGSNMEDWLNAEREIKAKYHLS